MSQTWTVHSSARLPGTTCFQFQAEKQLSSSWILLCREQFLFSSEATEALKHGIANKNHELVFLYDKNLVDEVWNESRPKPLIKPVRVHDLKYAGVDVASKLLSLRSELADAGSSAIIISMLDEVAWLLNLRGSDVPHSPVMYAYLIVEIDKAKLFIDTSKVSTEVMDHLKKACIELLPYDSILSEVERLAAKGAKVWMDISSLNAVIVNTFNSACERYYESLETKRKSKSDDSNGWSGRLTGIYKVCKIPHHPGVWIL